MERQKTFTTGDSCAEAEYFPGFKSVAFTMKTVKLSLTFHKMTGKY